MIFLARREEEEERDREDDLRDTKNGDGGKSLRGFECGKVVDAHLD